MAKKTVKKVDVKKVAKANIMDVVGKALMEAGYEVFLTGEDFGFTQGTIVCRTDKCDVQIKPITPKTGIDFYELLEEEEEDEVEETLEENEVEDNIQEVVEE